MTVGRVAVDVGATGVRVAGRGRVVEILPDPAAGTPELLGGLVEDPAGVVYVGGAVDPAVLVAGPGERVVVDLGHRATRVTSVRRGAVLARRSGPGGVDLDRAVAGLLDCSVDDARRVREELSLQPTAEGPDGRTVTADEVGAVLRPALAEVVAAVVALAAGGVPVLLVGGGARAPLPAELLDLAGLTDVLVDPRPDTAVVRAAAAWSVGSGAAWSVGSVGSGAVARPVRSWLGEPAPVTRRPGRALLAVTAVAVVLGGLYLLGASRAPGTPVDGEALAQYGYRFAMPPGWAHTGGEPQRRRSLLTPLAAPEGSDLIAVEATPLGYDAAAEPRRAAAELRAEFDSQTATGAPLSEYRPDAGVAGRGVTSYRERDGETTVQWFVLLDHSVQLSVGCRRTVVGEAAVDAACAHVLESISAD